VLLAQSERTNRHVASY